MYPVKAWVDFARGPVLDGLNSQVLPGRKKIYLPERFVWYDTWSIIPHDYGCRTILADHSGQTVRDRA